jgi:predicted nucleic acid-binding protein
MTAAIFVDTNIIVYAHDTSEPTKQPLARRWLDHLWEERNGRTSTQVLDEAYHNLTRKLQPGLSREQGWEIVNDLLVWAPQPVDSDLLRRAREIERAHKLSWWDSLIVAAAQTQNCSLLLSEDLQDRATYGSVTVRNPFTLGVSEAAATYASVPSARSPHRSRGRPRRLLQAGG